MATKATFSLDDATIQRLGSVSERLRIPKSQVIREAVERLHDSIGRLSERERLRQLAVIRSFAASAPTRPQKEVDKEIAEIRRARQAGGRGGMRRGFR
jgi:predicted transcriptional regulator